MNIRSAAQADGRGAPRITLEFSRAVISVAGSVWAFLLLETREQSLNQGDQFSWLSGS
jgi:hypothetical protein